MHDHWLDLLIILSTCSNIQTPNVSLSSRCGVSLSYFKDTISITQSSFPVQMLNKVKDQFSETNSPISCFTPTTVEEVKQIMMYSLKKINKRCDLCPLPTILLMCIDPLIDTISNIIKV